MCKQEITLLDRFGDPVYYKAVEMNLYETLRKLGLARGLYIDFGAFSGSTIKVPGMYVVYGGIDGS